ncbi:MAG: ribonuclease H-like domain-containing protein [Candidatus Sungbacteria bacterium]|nr:ribonuclease H-like domain-containing protein [Candidatus Sungbacteria bacterium]
MLGGEIVFDVETQKAFHEVGGRTDFANLGISLIGAYSYGDMTYSSFNEHEVEKFEILLSQAKRVIGFNIKHFDYRVLQPHLKNLNLRNLNTLDLMEEATRVLGFRPKLIDLAKATLGVSKSGHGLEAVRWYKEGNLEKLRQYCLDDVKITKDLFEFGVSNGHIKLESRIGSNARIIPVSWKRMSEKEVREPTLF